jgi:pilus assembly protein Flp/PilA
MMLSQLVQMLQARIASDERGAAAVEYGMLVALIAAVVIGIVFTLGGQIQAAFQAVSDGFNQ